MKNEKYNGYKNYNTWLIVVNLTNDYNFYKSVTEKKEKWTSLNDFKNKYKNYIIDEINWSLVSATDLKEWYQELIK